MTNDLLRSASSRCVVCASSEVDFVAEFSKLPRVSSDCRPFSAGGRIGICLRCGTVQKPADTAWTADASRIYQRYDMFRQAAERAEQAVFDDNSKAPVRRSAVILNKLHEAHPLPQKGRALDVGCGNGPTLRALAALVPAWDLFGHEISDTNASTLKAISGFQNLYTGEIADIPDRFDLIVLSQSLEHVLDPVNTLAILKTKLAPEGVLLVQVPNARLNVFDLVVADHRSHFDPTTLADAGRRAGFPHIVVAEWVYKELSMTVSESPLTFTAMSYPAQMLLEDLVRRVDWLLDVVEAARNVAKESKQFGVFGSSIAATWLYGSLSDHIQFFVDEDPSRIGQFHEDRPILAPSQVPTGASVFIPLVPQMAQDIAKRLRKLDIHIPAPQAGF
jgi:SAM-dependent methyltransferase